jgi:two-component system response regulator MtrA
MLAPASDASGTRRRSCRSFRDHEPSRVYAAHVNERVLLVEDDHSIRETAALGLERAGFGVTTAENGRAAVDVFRRERFDLVILDLMLPEMDGFEVCRQIRRESGVPIVMLTARSEPTDVVTGLELGADDYLTKPFDLPVLVARARAVLRRTTGEGPEADPPRRVGDLEVDPSAFAARREGVDLGLTATEFRLLAALARRPGQVFTREMLLETVWGYDYLGDSRLVDVAVQRLRAKVERDPAHPSLISTVRGVGYRLEKG